MPSWQARMWRIALRLLVKRGLAARQDTPAAHVAATRAAFERGEARYRRVPPDIRIVPIDQDGVRGEWVVRDDVGYGDRALLYVHGGGMVAARPLGYRSITIPLARRLGVPVFAVDYRRAPEHTYPAALDDTLAAYAALRLRIPAAGLLLAGDSAGGNLALATLLALRERGGDPRPVAGVIALSPWTDLASTGASIAANAASDDTLARVRDDVSIGHAYAPPWRWLEPLVSPLYGDYAGAPPLLIFASTNEMLLDDARALVARVRGQGGIATLVQEPGLPHAWPIYPFLPEARAAHRTIAEFAKRCWAAALPREAKKEYGRS
ncbi:MAG: alpha/beta hydrolase [Vulcanimicrobiaceae bacterium]